MNGSRFTAVRLPIFCAIMVCCEATQLAAQEKTPDESERKLFAGKVVLVREALKKQGIEASEELEDQVALQTNSGELLPIVPDWRGRAFFQDKRLRDRKVELIAFQKPGLPYLQVLTIYTFDEQSQRQYTDYWCDICAIPMYEIMQCQCCQGDVRLRFQPRELPERYREEKK